MIVFNQGMLLLGSNHFLVEIFSVSVKLVRFLLNMSVVFVVYICRLRGLFTRGKFIYLSFLFAQNDEERKKGVHRINVSTRITCLNFLCVFNYS